MSPFLSKLILGRETGGGGLSQNADVQPLSPVKVSGGRRAWLSRARCLSTPDRGEMGREALRRADDRPRGRLSNYSLK